ncbi:hypothetical protein BY458DRAFT_552747 [Sporodiniella umbellata]|nr:hypothetical protein BY458DRAFT_552747 [Sporodiniella umbellata]
MVATQEPELSRPKPRPNTRRTNDREPTRSPARTPYPSTASRRRPPTAAKRLSIADRFMSPGFQAERESSVEFPSVASRATARYSIADRFMTSESSNPSSVSTAATTIGRVRPCLPEKLLVRTRIADTFMKSSSLVNELSDEESVYQQEETPQTLVYQEDSSIDIHQEKAYSIDLETTAFSMDDPMKLQLEPLSDMSLVFDVQTVQKPWESGTWVPPSEAAPSIYSGEDFIGTRPDHSILSSETLSAHEEFTKKDLEAAPWTDPRPVRTLAPKQPSGFHLGCCFISCRAKTQDTKERKKRLCGRRFWVIGVFLLVLALSIVIYLVWPMTPLMRIEGAKLVSPVKITQTTQGMMVGNVAFDSDWLVNVTVDNRRNRVPTRLSQVQVVAKDALTGLVIGKRIQDAQDSESTLLPPQAISTLQLPIHIDYQARDSLDTTFLDLVSACSPQHPLNVNSPSLPAGQRAALPLQFWITIHFYGLGWTGYKSTIIATPATGGFVCPQDSS